ncbi:MAG: hypothetical protein GY856_46425 [bacterium]|nr:hypothetical protein [bacterium]
MEITQPSEPDASSNFIAFPDKGEMLQKLRSVEGYRPAIEPLFVKVSDRLALKAYDRSAFVFILIEMVYELEEESGEDFDVLLPRAVLALSGDIHLAATAADAFQEIKEAIQPSEKADASPADAEPEPATELPSTPDLLAARTSVNEVQLVLMTDLQSVGKRVSDLGMSTRMLVEMALSHPSHDNVRWSLQEISSMRAELRCFEELLSESEERILEAAGVLD